MKASEVLRRYANGERNFRNANLRGQSFKGQDLSGADFSGADLRGTNFTNAKLVGTNFSGARAGLQRRWVFVQAIAAFLLSASLSFTTISILSNYASSFSNLDDTRLDITVTTYIVQIILLLSYGVIFIYGFTTRAIGVIAAVAGLGITLALSISLVFVSQTDDFPVNNWLFLIVTAAVGGSVISHSKKEG